ncbi:MAG: hypothetical protein JW804_07510 [Sedimentisphaerales bacterium]|nr:hypothetical protein [Sedimentisphaerales bacterium]
MTAESDYFSAERDNIFKTLGLIEELLTKTNPSKYEIIAMGKLLQDIYTGIERVLRTQLESHNYRIQKSGSWHKDLLISAEKHSLITKEQFEAFKNLLLFRHLQIHGYGYMLDKEKLFELALPIPGLCRQFLMQFE